MSTLKEGETRTMDESFFAVNPGRKEYFEQKRLYQMQILMAERCAGGCSYCATSSAPSEVGCLPTEKLLELIDQAAALGVKSVCWAGGDPLLHPDWFKIARYALEKGIGGSLWTSGLVSREEARKIASLEGPLYEATGVHIDTINPEAYARVNVNPSTLEKKVQGYRNLLEAGCPPAKIMPNLTLTRPILDSIEETIDWFVDEMGARQIVLCAFKPIGFAGSRPELEPGLSEVRRANEYLARKLGQDWLRKGATPLASLFCQTDLSILATGDVLPCGYWPPELRVGNIFERPIGEIFAGNRDRILLRHEIKGKCGRCENNPVCIGCRANAYHYLGDEWESDPKCWLNPEAKEYYLSPERSGVGWEES